MFSVIFEVHPNDGKKDDYLGLAKHLKPILEKIDGFVDNERFESKLRPGWVLSHSTWRDERSVVRWRTEGEQREHAERDRCPQQPWPELTPARVCAISDESHHGGEYEGAEQARHQVRIRYEGGRREGLLGRGIKGHPGGHSIRRPPRTCMCR